MIRRIINALRRPDANLEEHHARILRHGRALAIRYGNQARHVAAWEHAWSKGKPFVVWPKDRPA